MHTIVLLASILSFQWCVGKKGGIKKRRCSGTLNKTKQQHSYKNPNLCHFSLTPLSDIQKHTMSSYFGATHSLYSVYMEQDSMIGWYPGERAIMTSCLCGLIEPAYLTDKYAQSGTIMLMIRYSERRSHHSISFHVNEQIGRRQ